MKRSWSKFITKIPDRVLKLIRRFWMVFAVLLVILALVVTLVRALTPWVKQYKEPIQQQLSIWIGEPVTIQDIETSWYWFAPVLKMNQVSLVDAKQHELRLQSVMVGINLWRSLLHWQIMPGLVYVDNAHVTFQQLDHAWAIEGLEPQTMAQAATEQSLYAMLGLLLSQDKIIIQHLSADIKLRDGSKIPVQDVNVKADHHAGHYRIYGAVTLAKHPQSSLSVIANLDIDPAHMASVSGQVYLSMQHALLSQWGAFFPTLPFKMTQGEGAVESWLELRQGHVNNLQSRIHLGHVSLLVPGHKKSRTIPEFFANMAWKRVATGWRLTADQVKFRMNGHAWPENAIMVDYQQSTPSYRLYVKTLSVAQVLREKIAWPASMQKWLALKPTGMLEDTMLGWEDGQLSYVLSHFRQLSWQASAEVPGLSQLSGALYWQPSEGRLEVDGDHTVLTPQNHMPPLTFDVFNAALDWKDLSQGLRVSMERLVLSHPNLVLSAAGAMDDPLGKGANLRLAVDFAAKSAQFWLPYIPSKGLKPKLDAWLKHDIPRINQASGRMVVSGPMANFPFDDSSGQFSINAHVSGVDLLINRQWPMNEDIDADLHVDKRTLDVDIDHAMLAGVEIQHINLSVPDIGSGKEALLLHGAVDAPGDQIKSYVFATPLKDRLSRWRGLDVSDNLAVDLNLEVPLYPESDHVLAKGHINFKHNHVSIQALDKPALFEEVTGQLHYNEYGLTDGGIDGVLAGYPFSMQVQPLSGPKAGTELRFEGEVTVDYLRDLLHHPLLSVMRGQMIVTGLWTVYPHEFDMDLLHLNSSLVGVAVDLPKPLGKTMADITPMTVDIAFHPQHKMDLQIAYADKLKGKIRLVEQPSKKWTATGDIHLGEGAPALPAESGLRISGALARVSVTEWQKIIDAWPKDGTSSSFLDALRDIDVAVGKVEVLRLRYPAVQVKAHHVSPQAWAFSLQQKTISGEFNYDVAKKMLSGRMAYLYLESYADLMAKSQQSSWKLHPEVIPNLDLTIDLLNYNQTDIGQITVKSTTVGNHWLLKDCTVTTPEYQLRLEGDWLEHEGKNTSNMQADLHLKNLAKSLERWHITPAMDAHYGQVTFSGQWPAPFYDFSLRHLTGQMHIVLKDGRISHLDRETEEKLGLGKLLSILSLQTIPRRLKLDFSDLSQKGYSFDVFKGNFQIDKGIMTTHDATIDGPVAFARMTGDLDLVNHLYDVDLRISPYIGASLPIVATIAGGPVAGPLAGVATWVALKIINQGMQKISAYTYKVSGPWLNPVVQQVSIVRSNH